MFNEQSVGRRVVSDSEGKGTITNVTKREMGLEIRVDFDNYEAYSFDSKGRFLGLEHDNGEAIKYLIDQDNKQGSTDARRIVAMLASRYRKAKQCKMVTLPYRTPYILAKELLKEKVMREFKIGDKVFSTKFGKGTVTELDPTDSIYPIKVVFDGDLSDWDWYTQDGHYWSDKHTSNKDIKHLNNINAEKDMKCTTQAEVFTELARVSKLIEGTDLNLVNMIKYKGEPLSIIGYVVNSKEVDFTFALALVEGKPVFAGDKLWSNLFNRYKEVIGIRKDNYFITKETVLTSGAMATNNCTWQQPKKTFTLNGIELPLPTAIGDTTEVKLTGLSHVNDNPYFLKYEMLKYRWDSVQDRDIVMKAITDLLDGVAK